jgi:tetratricopeptide (TPR) repeat protein
MTKMQVEMTCPYDGTKFTATLQMSGTSFDQTLDFKPVGAIQSPNPLAICPTNGFVFLKSEYTPEELERLRPLIFSDEFKALKEETPYYRASWILERSGAASRAVSSALLKATWETAQTPARYSKYAGELVLRLAADIEHAADTAERTNASLLVGELLRRLGRFTEAERHFNAAAKDLAPDSNQAKVAEFELRLIANKDTAEHMMSEIFPRRR